MGITYNDAAFLLAARADGAKFGRVLTLGRLRLYLSAEQLATLAARFGINGGDSSALLATGYAEPFFERWLGTEQVVALDCSGHEGSGFRHDLNQPVGPEHDETFDAVIDGGTLEHVFNFPVALASCMRMTRKGGSLFLFTMANNHLGHGFYQFSPELIYSALHPEQGFAVRQLILAEHPFPGRELGPGESLYEVVNPATLGRRVGLVNNRPVALMARAVRVEVREVFQQFPLQSDYRRLDPQPAGAKDSPIAPRASLRGKLFNRLLRWLPGSVRQSVKGRRQLADFSFRNSDAFRKRDSL